MEIHEIVTSLEVSKKLKEIGINQNSLFYYLVEQDGFVELGQMSFGRVNGKQYYSAYTAEELGSFLSTISFILEDCGDERFHLSFWMGKDDHASVLTGNKLCDLFGEVIILLINEKFITAEEVNERMK